MGSVGKVIGTVAGGALGSALGPMGTVAGASLGGSLFGGAIDNVVGGIFGGPKKGGDGGLGSVKDAALGMYGEGAADYAAQKDNRTAFGNQLADRALGKAPSIAEAQMKSAQDRNLSQQLAATKANRAINPALAFRQTQRLGAQGGQQIAQAAGIAKLQEQQQNQAAYQSHLNSIQQNRTGALGAATGAASALANKESADANADNAFTGNLLGTAGQLGAAYLMSDKNVKKEIKEPEGKSSPKSFLEALSAKNYKYKNPEHGEGQQLGIMAQDLEKAGPVGKQMVVETPQGKAVDYGKGFSAILAAQVELNERLAEIEKRYKSKKG